MAMRQKLAVSLIVLAAAAGAGAEDTAEDGAAIVNPAIDPDAFLRVASQAIGHRARHRLSEAEFIRMSRKSGTVILDTRSKARFDELHVAGAIHLSYPDITIASLAAQLPDKSVRILIYCNNNFRGAEGPFPTKLPSASLNLPTFIALYDHGYRNVYELGPLLDIDKTAIPFVRAVAPVR